MDDTTKPTSGLHESANGRSGCLHAGLLEKGVDPSAFDLNQLTRLLKLFCDNKAACDHHKTLVSYCKLKNRRQRRTCASTGTSKHERALCKTMLHSKPRTPESTIRGIYVQSYTLPLKSRLQLSYTAFEIFLLDECQSLPDGVGALEPLKIALCVLKELGGEELGGEELGSKKNIIRQLVENGAQRCYNNSASVECLMCDQAEQDKRERYTAKATKILLEKKIGVKADKLNIDVETEICVNPKQKIIEFLKQAKITDAEPVEAGANQPSSEPFSVPRRLQSPPYRSENGKRRRVVENITSPPPQPFASSSARIGSSSKFDDIVNRMQSGKKTSGKKKAPAVDTELLELQSLYAGHESEQKKDYGLMGEVNRKRRKADSSSCTD